MCDYLGLNEDNLGNIMVYFLINGQERNMYVPNEDMYELAGLEPTGNNFDKAKDKINCMFADDPTEYVNDWELYA